MDNLINIIEYKKLYMQSIAGTSATSIINKSSFEKILLKIPNISVQKNIDKKNYAFGSKSSLEFVWRKKKSPYDNKEYSLRIILSFSLFF